MTSAINIPVILKDAFDLFVECHNGKQFLKKHNLVTGDQKMMIRKILLRVCAICGPDQESMPGHKFLDLTKLEHDDYYLEGLQICLKWFANILEAIGKKGKKDTDTIKKVQATLDEILHEISLVVPENLQSTPFKQEIPVQQLFK